MSNQQDTPARGSKSRNEVFNGKGKTVGIVKDGVLYKSVRGSVHFLRKPEAIANDVAILKQAEQLGAIGVLVSDTETHSKYYATFELINRRGFLLNRGYGEQIALCLPYWSRCIPQKDEPKETRSEAIVQPQLLPAQLSLFAEVTA